MTAFRPQFVICALQRKFRSSPKAAIKSFVKSLNRFGRCNRDNEEIATSQQLHKIGLLKNRSARLRLEQ